MLQNDGGAASARTETADSLLWTAWPPASRILAGVAAHIAHCQQPSVKQEEHAEKGEEEPKGSKGNANLCRAARKECQCVNLASTHSCAVQSHCACRPACCMNCYGCLLVHMTGSNLSSS